MANSTKENVVELPGIKGKGVAPVSIPKINKLCDVYVGARDLRMSRLKEEVEAKDKLIAAIEENAEKIGRDREGTIVYRFGDTVIILKHGKVELKVKNAPDGSEEE